MTCREQKNQRFLENIFRHGPFQGHAFMVTTPNTPIWEVGDFATADRPVAEWAPWIVEGYLKNRAFSEAAGDDSVPVAGLNSGTHIYAAAMGSPVHHYADNNPCAMPFIMTAAEADRIQEPELSACKTLTRILEMADLLKTELGSDVIVGPPDMQSGFDSACLVWDKVGLFCAMMTEEEKPAVHRLAGKCAALFKKFIAEFYRRHPTASLAHCPLTWVPPGMGPWLSNDECGAMSMELFEEFCLPELVDVSKTFGGLGMHCCADAEHQFPSFRKIPDFYAFNRVAAKRGYDPILHTLGGPGGPVFVLAWLDDATIERLVKSAPAGTRFIFSRAFEKADAAKAWLEQMRRLSPRLD